MFVGQLACTAVEGLGFFESKEAATEKGRPDIQLYLFNTDAFLDGYFAYIVNMNEKSTSAYAANASPSGSFTLASSLLHPRSRGRLELVSSDPHTPLRVHLNYLQDERDAKVIVEGLKLGLKLGEAEALKKHGAAVSSTPQPGCEGLKLWSDAYLHCLVRHRTFGVYHESGTAAMGTSPADSVLDGRLRVHGVRGLRVADASAFPDLPSGNTNAPVLVLATRAAEFLLADMDELRG